MLRASEVIGAFLMVLVCFLPAIIAGVKLSQEEPETVDQGPVQMLPLQGSVEQEMNRTSSRLDEERERLNSFLTGDKGEKLSTITTRVEYHPVNGPIWIIDLSNGQRLGVPAEENSTKFYDFATSSWINR